MLHLYFDNNEEYCLVNTSTLTPSLWESTIELTVSRFFFFFFIIVLFLTQNTLVSLTTTIIHLLEFTHHTPLSKNSPNIIQNSLSNLRLPMDIHIYEHKHRFTAFCYAPDSIIGYSSDTTAGALINLARYSLSLPASIKTFEDVKTMYESFKDYPPTLVGTYPNTSLHSIRMDYPELFI